MTTTTARATYLQVLSIREFFAIFAGNIVSMLGSVVAAVALTVLIYERTGSSALAAAVMALAFLPYLVSGLLFGAAVDRLPARGVLVAGDLLQGALVAAMVLPGMPVAGLLALVFAGGLVAPVYQGVRSAMLPDVLPPGPSYILGRSLMRMVAQSAQIVGYGLGGLLLVAVPPRTALILDAASFAVSAVFLRVGTVRRPARSAGVGSMVRDSLSGLRGALTIRPIRRVLLFGWLVPACAVAPEALAAPYAVHIGEPVRMAGYLLMGIPAGTVVADVVAARFLPTRLQRRVVVPASLLVFAPPVAFAASPGLALAIALLVASGLGSAWSAGLDGLLIDVTPERMRGRVLAASSAGLMFTQGAGFALWGLAAEWTPLVAVIPAAAVAGAVVVVACRPMRPPAAAVAAGAPAVEPPAQVPAAPRESSWRSGR